jgi:hypothetical protein
MAFNVGDLTDYVNQSSTDLLVAAQIQGKTASLAEMQTGNKSSAALQLLTATAVPQDGTACSFNASGNVAFTQRILTTKPLKWEDLLCVRTLETKWTQLLLKSGQKYTEADIPKMVFDEIIRWINAKLEIADWMGDTNSANAYLSRYDGLYKIINAASPVLATASTFNATNARTIVKDIITKIPAALKGDSDVKIVMGYDSAEIYRQALMDANLFHVPSGDGNQTMYAEGSVYEIVPVHGLDVSSGNTTNSIYALKWSNVFLGVDMVGEEDKAEVGLDQYKKNVWYSFMHRRGWQVAYPSEIVLYKNS